MVLPGIQDAHVHPAIAGRNLLNVDLSDLADAGAYLERNPRLRRRSPRPALGRGGRVVRAGLRSDRRTSEGGPRCDRARPPGLPAQRGRPRGMGQLEGARARGARRHVTRSMGRVPRARCRWLAHRVSAGRCRLRPPAWADPDARCRRVDGVSPCRAALTSTPSGSRAGRTRGSSPGCSAPTARSTTMGSCRSVRSRRCGGIAIAGSSRSTICARCATWGAGGNVDTATVKIMLDGCPENGTGSMLAPYEGRFGAGARERDPVRRRGCVERSRCRRSMRSVSRSTSTRSATGRSGARSTPCSGLEPRTA